MTYNMTTQSINDQTDNWDSGMAQPRPSLLSQPNNNHNPKKQNNFGWDKVIAANTTHHQHHKLKTTW